MPYIFKSAEIVLYYNGVRVFRGYRNDDYHQPHSMKYQWHDGSTNNNKDTFDIRNVCAVLHIDFRQVDSHLEIIKQYIDYLKEQTDPPYPWNAQPGQPKENLEAFLDKNVLEELGPLESTEGYSTEQRAYGT